MMDWSEIQKRREQLAEGPVFAIPEERVADLAGQLAKRASEIEAALRRRQRDAYPVAPSTC